MRYKLSVVRYMIAVMLMLGGMQISYGQDNNVTSDCPPSSSGESRSSDQEQQNMSQMETPNDSLIQSRGNKEYIEIPAEGEFEYQYHGEKGKLDYKFEKEQQGENDAAKIELNDNQDQSNSSDMEMEQDQAKGCPDNSSADTTLEKSGSYLNNSDTNGTTSNADIYVDETVVYAVPQEQKKHSTAGTIVRAPVKFVGNIPKATVSLVSETVEGVGHVVGAPFKAIGKLFGREEPKDKYNHEHDNM